MKLYIVPTPVGNLADITARAVEVLRTASLIVAEDTRTSSVLLKHLNISTPMRSHHKYNEHQTAQQIAQQIAAGQTVAIISDAGTPCISDPGFLLVRTCVEQGIEVECLPGPTAFVPALVNSGLPCDRFVFEGFLPQKKGRNKRIAALSDEERTMVFYESPFRLLKLLQQLASTMGPERRVSISREISKLHEQTIRGTLQEAIAHFEQHNPKGEIVVVLEGKNKRSQSSDLQEDEEE